MHTTKLLGIAIPMLAAAGLVAALTPDTDPTERLATIPAGTELVAVLADPLSTARSQPGDEVELRTIEPIPLRGTDEIPTGVLIHGTVIRSVVGGRAEPPALGLRFSELEIEGEEHEITTEEYRFGTLVRRASSRHLLLPAGELMRIRLTRPVKVEYHPGTGTHAAE